MSRPEPARRPNVVVVFTDQQRWDTLGVAGNPSGLTPNLDRMAHEGTWFDAAVVPNPVCAPSRSAILTGRYPTSTGVYRNGLVLDPSIPTLGAVFRDAGYATGYIGKWHLAEDVPAVAPEARGGFETWLASNVLEYTSDAYRTVVYDEDGEPVELPGYRSDALVDAAIRYIADHEQEPFFLFISFLEPHHQNEHDHYPAPDGYEERYRDAWMPADLAELGGTAHRHYAGYCGQVKRLDEGLGRLRDALKSLELDESTIVVYTSDHGSHFKTRNDEYKRSCHDASVRVPLVVGGPGFESGGRRIDTVSTVDLAPTLVSAAGIDADAEFQGRDLTDPAVTGGPVLFQVSESETGRGLRTRRWKYYATAPEHRDEPGSPVYVERALYDLSIDPSEMDNLIGSLAHRDIADALRETLHDRIREIEQEDVVIDPYDGVIRPGRVVETTVRSRALRGARFGHQPARAAS